MGALSANWLTTPFVTLDWGASVGVGPPGSGKDRKLEKLKFSILWIHGRNPRDILIDPQLHLLYWPGGPLVFREHKSSKWKYSNWPKTPVVPQ